MIWQELERKQQDLVFGGQSIQIQAVVQQKLTNGTNLGLNGQNDLGYRQEHNLAGAVGIQDSGISFWWNTTFTPTNC